jgi:hypothetical protein
MPAAQGSISGALGVMNANGSSTRRGSDQKVEQLKINGQQAILVTIFALQ